MDWTLISLIALVAFIAIAGSVMADSIPIDNWNFQNYYNITWVKELNATEICLGSDSCRTTWPSSSDTNCSADGACANVAYHTNLTNYDFNEADDYYINGTRDMTGNVTFDANLTYSVGEVGTWLFKMWIQTLYGTSVYAITFYENGVSLADKYAPIAAKGGNTTAEMSTAINNSGVPSASISGLNVTIGQYNTTSGAYALGLNITMDTYVDAMLVSYNGSAGTYTLGVNSTMKTYADAIVISYNTTAGTYALGLNTSMDAYVDAQDVSYNTSCGSYALGLNTSMDTYVDAIAAAQDECSEITNCVVGAITSVVSDTTPQLGGYLDTNGQTIGSAADEIGAVYIADDTKIYLGSDQDVFIQFNSTTGGGQLG